MEDEDHNWIRQVKDGVVQYLNQLKPSQRLQIGGVEAVKLLHELTEVCIFPGLCFLLCTIECMFFSLTVRFSSFVIYRNPIRN